MLSIEVKSFSAITKEELYEMLQLRSEVFVVEQDCVYQDIDYKDQKALHVLGKKEGKLVAYTRIFNSGDYFDNPSIGRVIVKMEERKFGYGHTIMKASIEAIYERFEKQDIEISAQCYLRKFYNSHGFTQTSEEYLEDGIPHIKMIKN
ncbi:putative acyltransferase [Galbibacter orientalis DSM 19592]|uniref:Putative acyltransferase n=1 Tax=Galbibacter orientalis DSM 19592 TaxID=926559 RepID=I3C3H3_9FLAO|nr:GNAT family N-acetyltransferase [Galbibacter orientalis]EIJ38166.1 putative acyltransferase [Galbibacter orientalis DSM 19592]